MVEMILDYYKKDINKTLRFVQINNPFVEVPNP